MVGAHGTNGTGKKCIQNLSENLKSRDHSEDLDVDSRIVLE